MTKKKKDTALHVIDGIERPPSVNPSFGEKQTSKIHNLKNVDDFVREIQLGNRFALSKAITLVESAAPKHQEKAQAIIEKCLPYAGNSIRIGITGIPGVGKSTFIEMFGKHLTGQGKKVAVMAVDPSSTRSKGSILGDKTRMKQLSVDPDAFIRPSPSSGTLGGVARKTRESAILAEAAGFDVILIETVGVGQSETLVHSMVDFFLLLMLAGAGDELQGIKRGIMEMADAIIINKADGDNITKAKLAQREYQNALHLFPPSPSGWIPRVETCSSIQGKGMADIWKMIEDYRFETQKNGYFYSNRNQQNNLLMHQAILSELKTHFYHYQPVMDKLSQIEENLKASKISPYIAARQLMDLYFKAFGSEHHPATSKIR